MSSGGARYPDVAVSVQQRRPRRSRRAPAVPGSAVERGVRHNARRLLDGRWTWRYDLFGERPASVGDHTALWADVSAIPVPVLLVLGADSQFTGEEDVAEFR